MNEILVLGPGCYRCTKLFDDVTTAVNELGLDCQVIKVSDLAAIAGFGVMQTPALVINDEVKVAGKLLTVEQIKKLLEENK